MLLQKLLSFSCIIMVAAYDYEDLEYETDYEDYLSDEAEEPSPRMKRYPAKPDKKLSDQDMREVREAVKQLLSNIDQSAFTERLAEYRKTAKTDISEDMEYSDATDILPAPLTGLYDYVSKPTRSPLRKFLFHGKTKSTDSTTVNTPNATTTMTPTTLSTIPTAKWPLDVPALLDLIAVLAADYETNLTKKLNESLIHMSIPTCETFTPLTLTTSEYDANATGTVIAKCFVCGLEEEGVPRAAPCADAFAGDFLPLVPVDPTARAKISKFRKYCKYLNIKGYKYNETQPRAIFGRWTGGCGVRWIDLSGIYTQRTCRSRFRATMGKHYASKRMARLEMALLVSVCAKANEYWEAIFGRWTGGCGVRWIDLSGIYTQRTCRSRFRATMGKHYASKRMARLEMALLVSVCAKANEYWEAIFGRWTGGCGVRWIDLSGIHTQRTCRSRFWATMGKHYASKRMARLEMASRN